ncbi:MAG: hypothetical protein HY908_04665 [Myxococcales bacterium]|nr:hypothetical protein [Myxococcales bacterium]
MFSKTLPVLGVLGVLVLSLSATGCFPTNDDEAECVADNDPTPIYEVSGNPLVAPVPTVGAETSVFISLTVEATLDCRWNDGEANWFTGMADPKGCFCEPHPTDVPFAVAEASCPDGSCEVLWVSDSFELHGRAEREVRLVPQATAYDLVLRLVPDADPATVVEQSYLGEAAP